MATVGETLTAYDQWRAHRNGLGEAEGRGELNPYGSDFADSDDDAVELADSLAHQLRHVLHTISHMGELLPDWSRDSGGSMSCGEIDSIAYVLGTAGRVDDACAVLFGHAMAESEDGGDQHCPVSRDDEDWHRDPVDLLILSDPDVDPEAPSTTLRQYVETMIGAAS